MIENNYLRGALWAALISVGPPASALGYFSRACPVSEIPSSLKVVALQLAEVIGSAPLGSLTSIASLSLSEQGKYWIHESITADYVSARYYLFAENNVYRADATASCTSASTCNITRFETGYKSAGWLATTLSKETLTDSRFNILFTNRRFTYSARAGEPAIVKYWQRASYTPSSAARDLFSVDGAHYYYDPVAKVQSWLGNSFANSCNLDQWGFEVR